MDKNLQIAFSETKYVLRHLSKEDQSKIPIRLRRFIIDNYDKEFNVDINNLSKRTYALLAVFNRKYLAENKVELEKKYQERLKKEILERQNKIANSRK